MRQRPLRGTLDVAKKAIPHVIAHKLDITLPRKGKRVDKGVTGSQDPQLEKASVDTGACLPSLQILPGDSRFLRQSPDYLQVFHSTAKYLQLAHNVTHPYK